MGLLATQRIWETQPGTAGEASATAAGHEQEEDSSVSFLASSRRLISEVNGSKEMSQDRLRDREEAQSSGGIRPSSQAATISPARKARGALGGSTSSKFQQITRPLQAQA